MTVETRRFQYYHLCLYLLGYSTVTDFARLRG